CGKGTPFSRGEPPPAAVQPRRSGRFGSRGCGSPGLQPWVSLGSWKKQIKRKAESRTAGAIPAPLSPTTVVPIHLKEKCSYSRCCGGRRVLPRRTSEISSGSRLLEASAHRRSYASNG